MGLRRLTHRWTRRRSPDQACAPDRLRSVVLELGVTIGGLTAAIGRAVSIILLRNLGGLQNTINDLALHFNARIARTQQRQQIGRLQHRAAADLHRHADTLNVPKLMLDSLVLGMPGRFALSPYDEGGRTYLLGEQRMLWEYELKLDASTRQLIQAHLIELKQTNFIYFFHRYNCATLVKHVLAIAVPSVSQRSDWITTPKDVIRLADQAGVVGRTTVKTPSRWLVRATASVGVTRTQCHQLAGLQGPGSGPSGCCLCRLRGRGHRCAQSCQVAA